MNAFTELCPMLVYVHDAAESTEYYCSIDATVLFPAPDVMNDLYSMFSEMH